LLPPLTRLWHAERRNGSFEIAEDRVDEPPLALVGVRPCELHAVATQDRVLIRGRFADQDYVARREGAFIVAVDCFEPGGTCFCASMGTGPKAEAGYDLALTEILEGQHRLLVTTGTKRGAEISATLPRREATSEDVGAAERAVEDARARMGRAVETTGLRGLLADNLEHERWDDVAERCLTCGNCTLVCPTCFCTSVEEVTDLTGDHSERVRKWDSCFSMEYSYIHGGSVRPSGRARYRQWLTHKFGTWWDQFGESGCVGCGRCITWCPVGIDVTEELAAIRTTDRRDDEDH
jgi:ferredoxin